MEKFEKLNEFVEGRLHASGEKDFLGELASDDELRSEMKRLLTVNSTIRNNRRLFDVPEGSKAAIFGTLGIAGGPDSGGAVTNTFWGKFTNGIMLVGATIALVLLLFWGLHEDLGLISKSKYDEIVNEKAALQKANNTKTDKLTALSAENSSLKNQFNDLTANLSDLSSTDKEIIYKTIYVDRYAKPVNKNSNIKKDFSRSDIYLSYQKPLSDWNIMTSPSISDYQSIALPQYQSISWNEHIDSHETNSKSLSIELKKYEFIDIDNVSVPAGNEQPFNNTGLVIAYNLSDNLKLNAEIRRESFKLAFDGYDDLGQYQQFKSSANFNTYTLGTEYKFTTDSKLSPGIDVSLGGNKVGVVPRFGTSLTYELSDDFNLSLRAELSTMYFEFNGSSFFSNKAGISYGIEYIIK